MQDEHLPLDNRRAPGRRPRFIAVPIGKSWQVGTSTAESRRDDALLHPREWAVLSLLLPHVQRSPSRVGSGFAINANAKSKEPIVIDAPSRALLRVDRQRLPLRQIQRRSSEFFGVLRRVLRGAETQPLAGLMRPSRWRG